MIGHPKSMSIRLEKRKTFFVVQTLDILEMQRPGAKFNQVGPLYETILEFSMLDIVSRRQAPWLLRSVFTKMVPYAFIP